MYESYDWLLVVYFGADIFALAHLLQVLFPRFLDSKASPGSLINSVLLHTIVVSSLLLLTLQIRFRPLYHAVVHSPASSTSNRRLSSASTGSSIPVPCSRLALRRCEKTRHDMT